MAYTSGLNPNVVRTALDAVFSQSFSGDRLPQMATAEDSAVFNQLTSDSNAEIVEIFKGVGRWDSRQEEQDVQGKTPRIGNQKTFSVVNFAASVDIPKIFFDDQKHGSYEKMVQSMARRARTTRDRNAMAVFRNAFGSETTADAVSLINNSHTNLNGDTVDNRVTGAISESTLNDGLILLGEMRAQDGEVDGSMGRTLLVPLNRYKLACEITGSELRSGTGNNDLNVYSDKYGLQIRTSPFLGAASGGSDISWFLLSDDHSVNRYVRQGVQTDLVDYKYQRNNSYVFKGEFREVVGALSHEGIVGSNGS